MLTPEQAKQYYPECWELVLAGEKQRAECPGVDEELKQYHQMPNGPQAYFDQHIRFARRGESYREKEIFLALKDSPEMKRFFGGLFGMM